ncbi:factor-independent urate hydroxylase [Jidongwangia harbinensis]|uniref:factor-independent urate hydroxylase n=1 Tax=Jidongwangia harbinensis TaxID=2878561 RepID=UPI001CD98B45|nr:urate oxidase [Jidongwangia harbinensis]MCA2214791.1 urate oxidase [Jidongwangia harbinensis]
MAIVLGPNRYGKAEVRLVRVTRDGDTHHLADLTVGIALAGDLAATHQRGDNSGVLPTDTMKNTVYAFAKEHGVAEPESFALRLARHFVADQAQVHTARVSVEAYGWDRLGPHSFQRQGSWTRTCTVTHGGDGTQVVTGITGLVLLNTTASEFHGYVTDRYTTLPETTDRILATAVDARWRHLTDAAPWDDSFRGARDALVAGFVDTYSYSLQQTLYAMGTRLLTDRPEIAEVRLTLPNKHHYPVDLAPFGQDNAGEVFLAGDRPYGLIEGTVTRDDAPPASAEWYL